MSIRSGQTIRGVSFLARAVCERVDGRPDDQGARFFRITIKYVKTSTFQLVVLGIFGLLILAGLGLFAASGNLNGGSGGGTVVIWGTLPQDEMDTLLGSLRSQNKLFDDVSYVQQSPSTYDATLINAMAAGGGPDLFMIDQTQVAQFADKIDTIPYNDYPQGTYDSSFVNESSLFLSPSGIRALPILINPLVMYWNKDLFATAGVASPPSYWTDLITLAPKITSLDASKNVTQSAVALGEWSNIVDAKEILSTLMMQAGDPIVEQGSDGSLTTTLGETPNNATESPAASALRFYTEFADPSKTDYSWNNALPDSTDAFVGGQVAVYFGFASDYQTIMQENPNLNFGVAQMPQLSSAGTHLTYGDITGLAISHASKNASGALAVAEALSAPASVAALSQATGLPPVRRDVSTDTSSNAAGQIFAQSALIASGWLDPDPTQTDPLFQTMVESVISGAADPSTAVAQAAESMRSIIGK